MNVGCGVVGVVLLVILSQVTAWGGGDKVLLKEVEVLTLYGGGKMTAGRRSAGVPQLKCMGGTAQGVFVPQVVQCYNRGSDGSDVQWECKTDMDNAYRFGRVTVTCEGYDYPDDPYILKGSCGLEYTLDLTKEGMAGQHNYYGGGGGDQGVGGGGDYGWNPNLFTKTPKGSGTLTNLAIGAVVIIIVYAIYQTCIKPTTNPATARSRTNDDYPDSRGPGAGARPPPPGFRPSYQTPPDSGFDDSCSGSSSRAGSSGGSGAGGFWTGAATGGLLGYMFGARNGNEGYGYSRPRSAYRTSPGSSGSFWGGGGGAGSSSGYSSGFSSSSGTRSASGYGGTSRR